MLKHLKLTNVGPSASMDIAFAERLNLMTGDNGLGKSFLLDIAWWALTRKWPAELNKKLTGGLMAKPREKSGKATIEFGLFEKGKVVTFTSPFDKREQSWSWFSKEVIPMMPGLVLYAQADGGFAVWDPARNYRLKKSYMDFNERPPAYVFSPKEVWEGLRDEESGLLCNGLISDWAGWQKEKGRAFESFCAVLKAISPSDEELIEPGELTRIGINDPRDIPTIKMPYGQSVPVLHASAGIRRIIALAYLLVWSWEEHNKVSMLLEQEPTRQIIFLIDEIEAHLHPKWQRRIVRSLLEVVKTLAGGANVQVVASTHSPLVMASVEPFFDKEKDAWFDIDYVREENSVELTRREFFRLGDASNWLESEAFDLASSMSEEGEKAMAEAAIAMSSDGFGSEEAKRLDCELRRVLGETDPFWIRWRYVSEKKGWLNDSC